MTPDPDTPAAERLAAHLLAARLPLLTLHPCNTACSVNQNAAWELLDTLRAAALQITPTPITEHLHERPTP